MFKKIFRKVFLLGGILLLSTFMLVQLSWGCDNDDKWDRDHHDKWDCHKHGKPCQPPKIQRVYLDYQTDSIVFEIWGKNFDNGVTPVVTLGGIFDLTVNDALTDDNVITATLSSITEKNFEFGDYRLVVSTCHGSECKDKYCRDHGSKCKDKYCKDKYCKDHEYKCKCKDRYSLTIPGPSGGIGLKIESETLELPLFTELRQFEVSVYCVSGFRVTGGGFSCRDCLSIVVSEPLQDDKKNGIGWHVIATYEGAGKSALTVHAVCVKVQ